VIAMNASNEHAPRFPTGENPLSLVGLDMIEMASPDPEGVHRTLLALGFSRTRRHEKKAIDLYQQGRVTFALNREPGSFAAEFCDRHGPCISAMGWRFADPATAFRRAIARGAEPAPRVDYALRDGSQVFALAGIGGSSIAMLPASARWEDLGFRLLDRPARARPTGLFAIDHLTHNVERGKLAEWVAFYKKVFGFTDVRTFDIRGERTGLYSNALRSPCGTFCIPINEAEEAKSQINEYIERYRGPGIQHVALTTEDILGTLDAMKGSEVGFLDIGSDYYDTVFDRVPGVTEDRARLREHNVLVDGDARGYLLQIFTKDLLGPIFFEIIQRKNHLSFGEGNFGALFRSIERDQERRGLFA
jgi:4-hydroxyphenylpyruvate dioxygenase